MTFEVAGLFAVQPRMAVTTVAEENETTSSGAQDDGRGDKCSEWQSGRAILTTLWGGNAS